MPPNPCPPLLARLIDRVNEKPPNPPHALRQIVRSLQDRRQNKGGETFAVQSMSRVTINLDNYTLTVRSELKIALEEIDPPDRIDLIRECPECNCVFWAGRNDKQSCNRHAGRRRKRKQRQRAKADAEKEAAERKDAQLRAELQRLSRTAVALLNAIVIDGKKVFRKIDEAAWHALKESPAVRRVPNLNIVRQTIGILVDRGYLRHNRHRDDFQKDYYFPEPHLVKAWTAMHGKPPTR